MSVFRALDPANQGLVGVLLQTKRSQHPVDRFHGTVKLPTALSQNDPPLVDVRRRNWPQPLDSYPTI
jgi:hypothetical protein